MKNFIPQPQVPKTEEARNLEQEQKLVEKQTKRTVSSSSTTNKWENWGFVKKGQNTNSFGRENHQEAEKSNTKNQEVEHLISDKSDIIISLDEKWALPLERKEKTYEFRKYQLHPETKRMWFYVNQPASQLLYIAEIEPAVEYPNKIPENGIGNQEFNQGLKSSKFAYKIKHLYKLNSPIGTKELKSKYNISPPQKYTYNSKYTGLVNDIVIEKQTKLY